MGHRIKVKVRVRPLEELLDSEVNPRYRVASEVERILGCFLDIANETNFQADPSVQGWQDGQAYYREAIDSDDTTVISTETSASLIYIKNTGKTYSSSSELGDDLNAHLKIMAGSTDKEPISYLEPGEGAIIALSNEADIDASKFFVRTVGTDGGNDDTIGHLAVEFLIGNAGGIFGMYPTGLYFVFGA